MTQGVTILDGGMGKELHRIGAPFRQPEWSALALIEAPEIVLDAHENFIEAGAEVIIANAYAVVPWHLGDDTFASRGFELAELSARIARQAADDATRPVLVAGSLPPLFGSYEPGSFDPEQAPEFYRVLVEAQAPFVDIWMGETISCVGEFQAIADAVAETEHELWAAFSVVDELVDGRAPLRSSETVAEMLDAVDGRASAILFNCSPPECITVALEELGNALGERRSDVLIGAYANAFLPKPELYSGNSMILGRRDELTPEVYADIVDRWVGLGATIVGGCCEIFPEHIAELAERFG